jgi:hypothetical protein
MQTAECRSIVAVQDEIAKRRKRLTELNRQIENLEARTDIIRFEIKSREYELMVLTK